VGIPPLWCGGRCVTKWMWLVLGATGWVLRNLQRVLRPEKSFTAGKIPARWRPRWVGVSGAGLSTRRRAAVRISVRMTLASSPGRDGPAFPTEVDYYRTCRWWRATVGPLLSHPTRLVERPLALRGHAEDDSR